MMESVSIIEDYPLPLSLINKDLAWKVMRDVNYVMMMKSLKPIFIIAGIEINNRSVGIFLRVSEEAITMPKRLLKASQEGSNFKPETMEPSEVCRSTVSSFNDFLRGLRTYPNPIMDEDDRSWVPLIKYFSKERMHELSLMIFKKEISPIMCVDSRFLWGNLFTTCSKYQISALGVIEELY